MPRTRRRYPIEVHRLDFKPAQDDFCRLLLYAQAFSDFDPDWVEVKNSNEGFNLYHDDTEKGKLYRKTCRDGRELAAAMASMITEFEDVQRFPTLTSYVNRFHDTWVADVPSLTEHNRDLIDYLEKNPRSPWTMGWIQQMFEKEIHLLKAVQIVLDNLIRSDLYMKENGGINRPPQGPVHIENFQGVFGTVHNSKISQSFGSQIKSGDLESLKTALLGLGINSEDVKEIGQILESSHPPTKGQYNQKIAEWIGKMVSKCALGTWQFSLETASSVLGQAISTYLGWS